MVQGLLALFSMTVDRFLTFKIQNKSTSTYNTTEVHHTSTAIPRSGQILYLRNTAFSSATAWDSTVSNIDWIWFHSITYNCKWVALSELVPICWRQVCVVQGSNNALPYTFYQLYFYCSVWVRYFTLSTDCSLRLKPMKTGRKRQNSITFVFMR